MRKPGSLPVATHLQYLVLTLIMAEMSEQAIPGRVIRKSLKARDIEQSGPGFYQMMKRLEQAGWVEGEYTEKKVDGYTIQERHYTITNRGYWEVTESYEFYCPSYPTRYISA